jgi:ABC-type multidrug transport system fused ATPase/permease subunit
MASQETIAQDWLIIRRVLQQGKRYKWMILVTLLATAGSTGSLGFLASQFGKVMTLLGETTTAQHPEQIAEIAHVMTRMGLYALLFLPLCIPCAYLSWWAGQWVANRTMLDQRNRILQHLTALDLSFHHELTRGDLLTRLTGDLDRMLQLQQTLYGKLLQRPVEALAWFVVMLYADWRIGLVMISVLSLTMFLIAPVLRRTRRRSFQARQRTAENFSILEQVTAGIRVIKAMGSGMREQARYNDHNRGLFESTMRLARARGQQEALTYGGIFLMASLAMLAISYLYRHGHPPARMLLLIAAMGRLITILREVQRAWGDCQEQIPAVERVFGVLDRPSRLIEGPDALACPAPRENITIENVHFRYQKNDDEVLRGVNITIPVGATVALVGQTGAGKSTLLDLIPRFHDVTEGRIAFDGADIRQFTLDSLVHHVAIVQQDNFLFNDTVYNNIAYGRPAATKADIIAAARRAHVHEAILSLEGGQGYDTIVGDRGSRLSGGQRQRVAIARALLRDAPILLLDEPTSALDADSEQHVQEALQELMKGRTTVVVAHRLATIQRADIIYVLAGKELNGGEDTLRGTVVEHGSHQDLIARNGEYARLVRMQQLTG